ncbi:chloroplastic import inner membrane translocase subunit HP30-2-like [Bidens hawaiensis]|uniref:chloroplastic import inner membrane translocase subunit HP30-2-like n=1 Tax=Bidens hawaiensis TaxID=980011 RepID=UPI004048FB26
MGFNSKAKEQRRHPVEEFEKWVAKPVEAVIAGALMGVVSDVVVQGSCSLLGFSSPHSPLSPAMLSASGMYRPLLQSFASGGTMEQARNYAVIFGADSGISCVLKKLRRGKYDIHTRMVAGGLHKEGGDERRKQEDMVLTTRC